MPKIWVGRTTLNGEKRGWPNNAGKKGKERKRLTCDKVNYRMGHQFGLCEAFASASFVLLPHAEQFVEGGCVR